MHARNAKGKKSRYVGSCGIYLIVDKGEGLKFLLCHRRSKSVSEKNMIGTPGGIVERPLCGANEDFELGARATAVQELKEESGVDLRKEVTGFNLLTSLETLPVGPGAYWGEEFHRNYCVVLENIPVVTGPEKASVHEVARGGMISIGTPAGDGVHAWVDLVGLFARPDLMPACRAPLEHLLRHGCPDPLAAASNTIDSPSVPSTYLRATTMSAAVAKLPLPLSPGLVCGLVRPGDDGPAAKRLRGADDDPAARKAEDVAGSLAALLRGVR